MRPSPGECQVHVHRLQACRIGAALVDLNPARHAVYADRALEETPGSGEVPALGEHEIKGLPVQVHGAIEGGLPAFNLDVGFVHPPGICGGSLPHLGLLRSAARTLPPSVERGMIDTDAPFAQNSFEIVVRDRITDIEKHSVQEDGFRIVHALELDRANRLSPTN